jgi:hypothetical protein
MLLESLREAITLRSFWLGIEHPELPRAEVRSRAAAQLAEEHKQQRRQHADRRLAAASHPLRPLRGWRQDYNEPDVLRDFMAKAMGMLARLHRPEPPPKRVRIRDAAATQQPTPPPSLIDRITDALAPEPELPFEPPQPPMVRSPNSGAGVVLIPDSEFVHRQGLGDEVTQNWRNSIQSNITQFPLRRGVPSSGKYIG